MSLVIKDDCWRCGISSSHWHLCYIILCYCYPFKWICRKGATKVFHKSISHDIFEKHVQWKAGIQAGLLFLFQRSRHRFPRFIFISKLYFIFQKSVSLLLFLFMLVSPALLDPCRLTCPCHHSVNTPWDARRSRSNPSRTTEIVRCSLIHSSATLQRILILDI